jgi:Ca-activated chloride channel family protein
MMNFDHYTILGVPYNATPDEIRSAYFLLARNLHPDANPDPNAREQFLLVQKAYEVLSNAQKRAAYDASLPPNKRSGPELSISARYSRQVLPCLAEPQLTYVLLDLICTADIRKESLPPCHVCLVLDRSTSMAGDRMDMVKASALNLLQQLRSQDFLSVIAFSDRAEVLVPPTRASALSKSDHRISLMQTGGGTEILQGLNLGMDQLRQSDPANLRHLVLLTDGHTYGDDEACLELAKTAAVEGISISVLGIGHEWNDVLMDRIASLSGGESSYISEPRELDHFLMQKLADLETIYARGLKFEFETSPDCHLRYAFRLLPGISDLEIKSPILLGDLLYRKSISVLFEFSVPPLKAETDRYSLARGKITLDIPSRKMTNSRIYIDLYRPTKTNLDPETAPPVIVEAMAKLTLYRLQEKVRLEVGNGEIEKATRHLHYLATHLLAQGDRELAHSVLIEAEHVQQSRRLSEEGEKRIKYGTRALLLPPSPELKP